MVASGGPAAGGSGQVGPLPPSARPTWLLVLSSIMLIYGGLLLVSGLTALRDPVSAVRMPVGQALPPERQALARQLSDTGARVIARHVGGIRVRAVASLVVALLMLYAAAAAMSRDRHGRRVTLVAAWFGIAYQLGTLPLVVPIVREYASESAPMLAELVVAETAKAKAEMAAAGEKAEGDATVGQHPPDAASVAKAMQSVFVGTLVMIALLGVFVSLLLIHYFGGRRGRTLYGLGPAAPPR